MRKLKNTLILFSILNLATACLNSNRSLENLGSTDDFKQQEIDPDFEAPEDETEAEKNTCSGFVNTKSGNLNVRTDSNTNSTVCTQLASKTSLSIALDGHKNGFIKITTPKCEQEWVYVSEKFVGLGSDCPFESTQPQEPTPEPVKTTCSGYVDTQSSRLNARTGASSSASICAKLDSKSPLTVSLEGHANGYLKIKSDECGNWAYVSSKYVGLNADCPSSIVTAPTPPAPNPAPQDPVVDRTPDSLVNTFYIERQDFNLANGKSKRWDGCKSGYKSVGGYNSNSKCGRAYIHEKFSKNLNQQFYKCVFNAADSSGYEKTQKVFINHLGSYNDRNARNSSRKSNHAYARALDIKYFNLVDSRGKTSRVSTLLRDYKGSQAKFYDNFRDCWRKSMPSSCRSGQSEYKGSIGHKSSKLGGNTLHNDHIHLSFPLCAG